MYILYCCFSDDGEHYDSDPDSGFPPPRNTQSKSDKSSPTKEYKDTESVDSCPVPAIGKITTPVRTKTKTSTPSKKVDLGAAANYGKTQVRSRQGYVGIRPSLIFKCVTFENCKLFACLEIWFLNY